MKSLCVLRLSALGDCCHALSVVQHLRVEFPDAKLCWIIGKTEYELFKGLEDVEFIIFDKSKRFSSLASTFLKLRSYRFDILLNLHASATANLVSLCVRANRKIGYDSERARDKQNWFCNESIPPRPNQHVADAMMNFVRHLNIEASSASWTPLVLDPEEDLVKANIHDGRLRFAPDPPGAIVNSYVFDKDETLNYGLAEGMFMGVNKMFSKIGKSDTLNFSEDDICRQYSVGVVRNDNGKGQAAWCTISDDSIKNMDQTDIDAMTSESQILANQVRNPPPDDGFQNMKGNKLNPQNLTFDDDIPMKVYYGLLGVGGIYLLYQLSKKYGIKLNLD